METYAKIQIDASENSTEVPYSVEYPGPYPSTSEPVTYVNQSTGKTYEFYQFSSGQYLYNFGEGSVASFNNEKYSPDTGAPISATMTLINFIGTISDLEVSDSIPSDGPLQEIKAPDGSTRGYPEIGGTFQYPSYVWVDVGPATSLTVDAADKPIDGGTLSLQMDDNGNVTNSPVVRLVHYTDSHADAVVNGLVSTTPTVSASFIGGGSTNISADEISNIVADLSTNSISDDSARLVFDPKISNLSFIAPGETINISNGLTYSDQYSGSDVTDFNITFVGQAKAWETVQAQKSALATLKNMKTAQDLIYKTASTYIGLKAPTALANISSAIGNAIKILGVQIDFNSINSSFQSQYIAAGNDPTAQYKAVENATVSIESAAIKSSIKVAIGLVVKDYGLAAATLAGSAVADVALSAASQVTLSILATAVAPEIIAVATPIIAAAIVAYAAGKAFDYVYDNIIDPQIVTPALSDLFESSHASFSTPLTVRALDGYLSGSTVFSDTNANGQYDVGEASSTTDSTGTFVINSSPATLVAIGGTDISTGLAFQGTLTAPGGSTVITPLTTLVEAAIQQGSMTLASAQSQVEVALGLDTGIDLTSLDPIANAASNQTGSAAVLSVSSQLVNTAAIFLAGGAISSFYSLLADEIQRSAGASTSTIIDLNDTTTLVSLAVAGGLNSTVAADIAAIAASSNKALNQFAQTDTGSTLLSDVAAVSKIAQGTTVAELQAARGDSLQLQAVVAANTGANLTTEIAQARASLRGDSTSSNPGVVAAQPLASIVSGEQNSTTMAEAPVQLFTSVSLSDGNANGTDAVDITLTGIGGTLLDGAGFSGLTQTGPASYALTPGSAAAVSAELNALVFKPKLGSLNNSSTTTFVLRDANSAGLTSTSAPISVTDTPADTLSITVAFAGKGMFTISGQATSPSGVVSIEFSADVNGQRTDLGAATVSPDGTYTFDDAVGDQQSFFVATLTDGAGGTATSADPGFNLTGGLGPHGTEGRLESFDPTGQEVSSTLFRANGTRQVSVEAPGQTVAMQPYDTVFNHGRGDTTFVYTPGGETGTIDVVRGFKARGPDHDVLSLKGADFGNSIAEVLRHTGDVNGSAFVTDPVTGDSIRLAGVSSAELKRKDFSFQA